jgi:hypothetical protein
MAVLRGFMRETAKAMNLPEDEIDIDDIELAAMWAELQRRHPLAALIEEPPGGWPEDPPEGWPEDEPWPGHLEGAESISFSSPPPTLEDRIADKVLKY